MNEKKYNSATTIPIASKFGRKVVYHVGLPFINLHESLITWSWEIV